MIKYLDASIIVKKMKRIIKKPETALFPLPAVLVSIGKDIEEYNIITISWTGTINSIPPMCYISVRPERHSYEILKRNMEFVINLTNKDLLKAVDWCGNKSGKEFDKFKEMNLTPGKAQIVEAPMIMESPLNIECKVVRIIPLGSHDLFISNIVAVHFDEKYADLKTGAFSAEKADLITYSFKHYFSQGSDLGKYGSIK
jgi:flavin reductase (DIM6/NTAB) family NADH-FMN oxidoreductase RutF